MSQATAGRIVHVLVHPDDNGGQDHAPAIITRVVDGEHRSRPGFMTGRFDEHTPNPQKRDSVPHQLVDLTAFTAAGPKQLTGVPLYASRSDAHDDQVEHRKSLGTVRHPDGPEAKWSDHDVYRWTAAAYWPERDTPIDQPEPEPAPEPETEPEPVAAKGKRTAASAS